MYYWAGAGSLLAMLTPDLQWNFPRWEFVVFFGLHGLVLAAALLLVFGLGLRPRAGAPLRVARHHGGVGGVRGAREPGAGHELHVPAGQAAVGHSCSTGWARGRSTSARPRCVAWALFELLSLPFRREWRNLAASRGLRPSKDARWTR